MEEFKTSSEMKDLNITFSQKAFNKDFELYEGRIAQRFLELDLDFLEEEETDEEAGPSSTGADPSSTTAPSENPPPNQGHDPSSSIDADPSPQGVSLKPLIKSLKKEVHHLKKKLKKIGDDLQTSWKNASEVTKEVTLLRNLHMKNSVSFSIRKGSFERKISKLKKNASDKS
ncbi:hypothetical protein COCNU_01G017100 [Cocos nucifera]|uniref:Uncharacterized protein n=1 Tax=Cocos nucifera TaxID=13894 RepID=A0A8K0MV77_COCNU|nr:hypothetical protein COCNU_01G017100 [Cocos nucifera]